VLYRKKATALLTTLVLTFGLAVPVMAANPASGITSTGQTLGIEITGPVNGSRINVPPGAVTAAGTVSIGPLSNSGNVMYVVDVSGSTLSPTNQDCNGDHTVNALDDLNNDGVRGSTLDCEIGGVLALNNSLAGSPGASAGVVVFGTQAAIADVDPAGGQQNFTSPLNADENANGRSDIEDVTRSIRVGLVNLFTAKSVDQSTNFDAALTQLAAAFTGKAGQNNISFFLSDGVPNAGQFHTGPATPLASVAAAGIKVNTYSVGGAGAGCGAGSPLKAISDATGGTCTAVTDPNQLTSVLIQPATIVSVAVRLNGGAPVLATLSGGNWSVPLTGLQGGIWNDIRATVTASEGTTATADIQVYGNRAPMADAGSPMVVAEGSVVVLNGTATDPDGDALTVSWAPSTHLTGANTLNPSFTANDNMTETLTLTVTDPYGLSASSSTQVVVQNVAPTATLTAPGAVNEGSPFSLALTNPYDPSVADTMAGFTYSFDCGNGAGYQSSAACTAIDNPSQTVRGRITDKDGGYTEYTAVVTVNNVAPTVGAITAPVDPNQVGTTISTTAAFTDPGVLDTHTAVWNWGDGTTSAGTVAESGGNGTAGGSHVYSTPGIYTVTLTVTDKDGGVGTSVFQYVVVYDPDGGFVTGGGWITSPAGAYVPDPTATGRANFGLVSKYQKGATVPTGETEFQFKAGSLNFHSTSYDWLVIAGARAQYKGTGTINGAGDYRFMLTAIDGQVSGGGGVDKFRIKIWNAATSQVVYDNQMAASDDATPTTAISQGSIVIHK
jgi:hypothetical protein